VFDVRKFLIAGVVAVAVGAAATTIVGGRDSQGVEAPSFSVPTLSTGAPSPAGTGSKAVSSPAAPIPTVPPVAGGPPLELVVDTRLGRLPAHVVGMDVKSGEPVDPPHDTAQEWLTAVWIRASPYPASPSSGTTYIYGHACLHHVCPFTKLGATEVGDFIHVTTTRGELTYRVTAIGLSPKSATYLPTWARDIRVRNRLVLVTCAFERDSHSVNNIVVVAKLVAAK
jgi:LPXTG-site transpeptidase (sortase) family protein